ncbi:septum formation initiator family protein, partial [Staphylococcus sp. EG-SA-26]|uniref:septum formation initiator family protein n=1 Tax=Staphylococcus sp. EG-SA-26 TaxID=2767498 RepID=UPI001F11E984
NNTQKSTLNIGIKYAEEPINFILKSSTKLKADIDFDDSGAKEAQFQKQQNEEIALKEKLNNLNDKDYIEKIARDDYYLSNK